MIFYKFQKYKIKRYLPVNFFLQKPIIMLEKMTSMKRSACIIGYATSVLIALYTIFKFSRLPGAWILMIVLGVLLSIYFPLQILVRVQSSTEGRIYPVHIIGAFCSSLIIMAILFKFQHWTGAGILFLVGLFTFSLLFIPLLFYHKSKKEKTNYLMNGAGAIGFSLISLGVLGQLMHYPFRDFLFAVGHVLIFLIYFPLYAYNKSNSQDVKIKYFQNSFNILIIGYLLFLFIYGTIMKWPVTYLDLIKP